MDIRVLKSLTTCALHHYVESSHRVHFPAVVAAHVVGVDVYPQPMQFYIGFNMALEIAALIMSNPAHVPALDEIIDKARADLRDAKVAA